MKKAIAVLLTLCMVAVVVPPTTNNDLGISTYAYSRQTHGN